MNHLCMVIMVKMMILFIYIGLFSIIRLSFTLAQGILTYDKKFILKNLLNI